MKIALLDWKSIDDPPIAQFKALLTYKETLIDQILSLSEELALPGNEQVYNNTNDDVLELIEILKTMDMQLRDLAKREHVFGVMFGKIEDKGHSGPLGSPHEHSLEALLAN